MLKRLALKLFVALGLEEIVLEKTQENVKDWAYRALWGYAGGENNYFLADDILARYALQMLLELETKALFEKRYQEPISPGSLAESAQGGIDVWDLKRGRVEDDED